MEIKSERDVVEDLVIDDVIDNESSRDFVLLA